MYFVGHITSGLQMFQANTIPTSASHGHKYGAVIGPFRTRRGAQWAEKYGYLNPHFQHVNDAERLARSGQTRL